jgi:hypothetical protein
VFYDFFAMECGRFLNWNHTNGIVGKLLKDSAICKTLRKFYAQKMRSYNLEEAVNLHAFYS